MNHIKTVLLLLIMIVSPVACVEVGEEPATPTMTTEVAVVPTEPPAEPTATPAPTEAPPEPTATPIEPTVTPTNVPATATPAPQRLGLLIFRDVVDGAGNALVRAGSYQLLMESIAPAPAGSRHELWLVDSNLNTLNLGALAIGDGVNFSGSINENLLGRYNGAFISIQPDGVFHGEIGPHAYVGLLPAESLMHIRHVVTVFDNNPGGKAFLIGAEGQLLLAMEHTEFMLGELVGANIHGAQVHAEHVINILEGERGPNFGDLDGDGVTQNPGDGFGVVAYLEGAKQHVQLAADAEAATAEVKLHAGHVLISSDNTMALLDAALGEALRVIAADTGAEAQPRADTLAQLLAEAYYGKDADGDGAIAPVEGEGGWKTAYEHALYMGSFEFFEADPATAPSQSSSAAPAASFLD